MTCRETEAMGFERWHLRRKKLHRSLRNSLRLVLVSVIFFVPTTGFLLPHDKKLQFLNTPRTFTVTCLSTVESKAWGQTRKSLSNDDQKSLPQIPRHVGLICDGNGRWAHQRNLPRSAGHIAGASRLVDLIESILNDSSNNVDCLTFYAFSTENWNRSEEEISKIFEAIESMARTVRTKNWKDLRIILLGDMDDPRIPKSLKAVLGQLEAESDETASLSICLAINYGGRRDIVQACRAMATAAQNGTLDPSTITEENLSENLSTSGLLPPDLIIRTGGQHRLSNFLLWEAAYAELCVLETLWPDFTWENEWKDSLAWFAGQKRNFGGRNQ